MERYTLGKTYNRGIYTRRDIHMEEHTYKKIYTWGKGDIYRQTYSSEYIQAKKDTHKQIYK